MTIGYSTHKDIVYEYYSSIALHGCIYSTTWMHIAYVAKLRTKWLIFQAASVEKALEVLALNAFRYFSLVEKAQV